MDDVMDDFHFYDFEVPQVEDPVFPRSVDGMDCDVEGKLFIQLKNVNCQHLRTKKWYQKFSFMLSVGDFHQKVSLKRSSTGSYDVEDIIIFDVYEYFGPLNISISLQQGKCSQCTYTTTLHEVCARQRRLSRTKSSQNEACPGNPNDSLDGSFWSIRETIELTPCINQRGPMAKGDVTCELSLQYTSMKAFVSFAHTNEDCPFRCLVQYGAESVLCDVLETLSRNQLLRVALAICTPSAAGSDHGINDEGYLPLEHALLARNVVSVGVLLRRSGNWCFQSTSSREEVYHSRELNLHDTQWPVFEHRHERYPSSYRVLLSPSSTTSSVSPLWRHSGCAIHAAVRGGDVVCLGMLLRFLRRYRSNIVQWHIESHVEMVDWVGSQHDGYTPLMLACSLGRTECVRLLIAEGATLDAASVPLCLTPLMLACSSGSLHTVNELLSHYNSVEQSSCTVSPLLRTYLEKDAVSLMKSSPYVANIDGKQALGIAAEAGYKNIVEVLIQQGISYSHKDIFGRTALHLAAANGHTEVCETIISAEMEALFLFDKKNDTLRGRRSVTRKTDIESESEGDTKSNRFHSCYLAVSKEEKVGKENPSVRRKSPDLLHNCAGSNSKVHASLQDSHIDLLSRRVLTDMTPRPGVLRAVDWRGRTPLMVAEACGHRAVVILLRKAEQREQSSFQEYASGEMGNTDHLGQDDVRMAFEEEEEAINSAYVFAKTMYFDPLYDDMFHEKK